MRKADILKLILAGVSIAVPPAGAVITGVEALIKRDDNPDNDLEETAEAIKDIGVNAILAYEQVSGKDLVNNPVLLQLAENLKGDVLAYTLMVKALKPPKP